MVYAVLMVIEDGAKEVSGLLRADDIVNARFTKVFRGYDIQEVDLFLDEVIDTLDEMEEERDTLLARLEALLEELERCDALLELHNIKRPELEEKGQ